MRSRPNLAAITNPVEGVGTGPRRELTEPLGLVSRRLDGVVERIDASAVRLEPSLDAAVQTDQLRGLSLDRYRHGLQQTGVQAAVLVPVRSVEANQWRSSSIDEVRPPLRVTLPVDLPEHSLLGVRWVGASPRRAIAPMSDAHQTISIGWAP
jgi:hypothetical protein